MKRVFRSQAEQGRERGGWASALKGSRYYRLAEALAAAFNILCLITVSARDHHRHFCAQLRLPLSLLCSWSRAPPPTPPSTSRFVRDDSPQANCAIMFGFGGSYDFLYHSFVKAGGGSSLLLCVLFYAALNMCPPALMTAVTCAVSRATSGSTRCDCLLFVSQVPAGYAQAGERRQRVRRENVAHAARRGCSSLDRGWEWRCMPTAAASRVST